MSDVRLSNGSPTLERSEPRPAADHPKPSACRSLFGSVDHEELKRDLKGHLREMEEAAAVKWGFDFPSHTPLPGGRLHWERVDSRDVPAFYCRQPRRDKKRNNTVDLNGNHSSCECEHSDGRRQAECVEQCSGQRKRPACHEPSAQSKRSHTSTTSSSSSSEEGSCPNLSHTAEHTPTKNSPTRQT